MDNLKKFFTAAQALTTVLDELSSEIYGEEREHSETNLAPMWSAEITEEIMAEESDGDTVLQKRIAILWMLRSM